jgi:signal transduction histidine kinase
MGMIRSEAHGLQSFIPFAILLSYEGISPRRRDTGPILAQLMPANAASYAQMNSPFFPTRIQAEPDAAACQLCGPVALLRLLADGPDTMPAPHSGCWLARLLQAYLSGNQLTARGALDAATALATPLTAPSELLPYHLFAALTLAQAGAAAHGQLRTHRQALQEHARREPGQAGALAALALAAEHEADRDTRALGSYEAAAALAREGGQTWVAALAWERAAGLSIQLGIQVAAPGYRRLALDAWREWGAHGRVRQLMQEWQGQPAASMPGCHDEARATRADTVGELGITIAHEVNQPLAAVLLHAAAAKRWLRRSAPDTGRALEALDQITVCGRQAGDIVRSVRGLARRRNEDIDTFVVDAALDEVAQLLRGLMQRQGIRFDTRLQLHGRELHANRAQFQQILMNLLLNAIEALADVHDEPRRIVLETAAPGPNLVELRVIDNGPGVAPQDRARIFDALYSTKQHGSGVGLSVSRTIAEAQGGRIEFVPVEPRGAMFRLVLPVRSTDATRDATERHHA